MKRYRNDKMGLPGQLKLLCLIDYLLPAYIVLSMPLLYLGLSYEYLFKGFSILVTLFFFIKYGIPHNSASKYFTAFLVVVTFSFIQYIYNGRPIICYIRDASNYIAAMLFFYIGVIDDRPGRPFYKKLAFSIAFVFAIGLFFFVTTPSWYISRNLDIINTQADVQYSENSMMDQFRYCAFFGDSYSVSHLSVFCVAIALFSVAYDKGRTKLLAIVCLLIGLASSIASMHRASILGSALALMTYAYFNHKTHRYKENALIALFSIIVVFVFLMIMPSFTERLGDIWGMVTERVEGNMDVNKAVGERKFTKEVLSSMQFFMFGHGLGSCGGSVRSYGFPGITDMQYIKMFFENGIIGAILFIGIIVRALRRGIKYIRYYMTEVAIILFILVAMLGSNSLSIYYFIVYPFWYAVGRISNDSYLQRLKNKEWIY